jgi:orotate phosphoribosyltransferase
MMRRALQFSNATWAERVMLGAGPARAAVVGTTNAAVPASAAIAAKAAVGVVALIRRETRGLGFVGRWVLMVEAMLTFF